MGRQGEIRERIRASLEKYISASGYTQKEIAEKLGVSKSSITNWLKGKNSPDANLVMPICKLLNITVGQFYGEDEPFEEKNDAVGERKAPSLSDEAMKLAEDYDGRMDDRGRETVRGVADLEVARFKARTAAALRESREQMEAGEMLEVETLCFMVPWFFQPMGAGPGEMAGSEPPEDLRLTKAPPRGTSFVARVHGDSMKPTYHDGDLVFVHSAEEIQVGRIGAFFMDGQQWIKELGDEELISHNPDYDPIPMREDIRCQGLVLGVCDESYFE